MSKRTKITIAVICVIVIAAVIAVVAANQSKTQEPTNTDPQTVGEQNNAAAAPDFTAPLNNGKTFTLSEHKDQVVLLNFWATWCPPCVGELPAFEQLKNDQIDGLEIVAVNCAESKRTVDSFIAQNGYTFQFAYDENGAVGALYPTDGIPYTLVIKDGKIVKTFLGAPRDPYNEYKNAVLECLGQ